jgi:TonB-dependent SusC/RagA subfamily outer membrane receptor
MFITTSNGKDPLYIVNDKEVSKDKFIKMKPKNIESVTVLKDESAIEKYGDKAKNGVIIIKTKKD